MPVKGSGVCFEPFLLTCVFLFQGGNARFWEDKDKLRFEIDHSSCQNNSLIVSTKLLRLSRSYNVIR